MISACTCIDSGIQEWTALTLAPGTDLANFSNFTVTIRREDGSLFATVDLVDQGSGVIDLSPLNSENPIPTVLTITATATTVAGETDSAWFGTDGPTLIQAGGTRPTLLS